MQKDISIIIVNYNVRHFIKRTIESILASKTEGISYEIFVIDNASIDGSVEMIARDFPQVNLIANKENVGFSTANNQAIRQAKGSYVLILNPDTIIEEQTLHKVYRYMEENAQVGALGVKMIDGSGKFLPESKRALPTLWNSFTKLSGLSSFFSKSKLFNNYSLGHLDENKRHEIDVLCGAFMFVRSESIDKVGMFDERFFMYGEDIDWSKRIKEGGYEIHYIPDTTIIHYKGESTKKASLNYVKTFYGAMSLYVEKHYQGSAGKSFAKILKLAISVRAFISGIKRVVSNIIKPVIDFIIISASAWGFAQLWATYYFKDSLYYSGTSLDKNIILYAFIWVFSLWFMGSYLKNSWVKKISGVALGSALILIIYALLPDQLRTSRAIILIGSIITFITISLTSGLWNIFNKEEKQKNILIVADKLVGSQILETMTQSGVQFNFQGFVSTIKNDDNKIDYLNSIDHLAPLTKILKTDEVIFSTENLSMKEIMHQMTSLSSDISFKIAGDDSLSILGSQSKNTTGQLYHLDIQYQLADDYQRHTKRLFDIVLGLVCLLFFPVLLFFNKLRIIPYFGNTLKVLFGWKTWIGYGGDQNEYQTLPELQKAVVPLVSPDDQKQTNLHYAKYYNLWKDVVYFTKNLTKIAD